MARKIIANNLLFEEVTAEVAKGNSVEIPTKGNSMFPFIIGGKDSLLLEATQQFTVGDIVLAKIGGMRYVVHRIVAIEGENITLMGDGNLMGQEYCVRNDVVARVKEIFHEGKAIDCNTPRQRRRAWLWRLLCPLRRYIFALWRRTPFWPL